MYPEYETKKKINGGAVTRIVIWSVVLAILVGLLACGFVFGGDGMIFGISLGGYTYDDPSSYEVGNIVIEGDGSVTSLDIDWVSGRVEIVPSADGSVKITEDYGGDDTDARLRWKLENGRLTVKFRAPAGFASWNDKVSAKKLTVEIPVEMLNELQVTTVSADLAVLVSAKNVEIDSVSGNVEMKGDYSFLEVDTVSGNIGLEGSVREADFDGTSATVTLYLSEQALTLDVDTVSGDVTLVLPANATGFEADIDSVSGSVRVNGFDGVSQSKTHCRWGDGSMKISMDGVSAMLVIKKAGV